MKGNYIKIDRKILKWEWYGNINTKVLFLHCLLKANWQDGRFEGREIKRGSFVTSLKKLSQETGLTVRQVRDALDHLILTGELTSETTNKFRIITVNNYSEYQDIDNQNDNQMTNNRQTTDKQLTTIEEYKEYKEGEKERNIKRESTLKGTREKESEQKKTKAEITRGLFIKAVPDYHFSDRVNESLTDWIDYKVGRKQYYETEIGMKKLLNKVQKEIADYGESEVLGVIDDSIANNYQGIIWDKLERNSQKKQEYDWRTWANE